MISAPFLPAWIEPVQAAATFGMTGVIWMVQLVQYPGFARVGASEFAQFHRHHCQAIAWVVGPLMTAEILTSALLAYAGEPAWFWRSMFGGLVLIWVSTALWQGRLHGKLATMGPQAELIRWLVRSNWLRTLLWSARSAGLVWFYARGWA